MELTPREKDKLLDRCYRGNGTARKTACERGVKLNHPEASRAD